MLDIMTEPVKVEPKRSRGRPRHYPFPDMQVGDAVTEPYRTDDHRKDYIRVRTSVLRWARQNNRKFIAEKRDNGIYVQRTE